MHSGRLTQLHGYLAKAMAVGDLLTCCLFLFISHELQSRHAMHAMHYFCAIVLHLYYVLPCSNIISDCCVFAVSFLTVAWMTITPVSFFWGAFLPLHAAWSCYDRPLLSPVFITFIPMMLMKFPPGYPVRLF